MRSGIPLIAIILFCSFTDCLVDWNRRNVGIREATDENDGLYVQKFLSNCNLNGNYAWCGCYVLSGFLSCGVTRDELPACAAYAPCWMNANVIWNRGEPINFGAGDVFGLYYASKKRIGHVGYIIAVQDGYCLTIEGNARDNGNKLQSGDGVHLLRRQINEISQISRWGTSVRYHTIKYQETLYRLSIMYNVPLEKIRDWNNLTSDIVFIGQRLRVS